MIRNTVWNFTSWEALVERGYKVNKQDPEEPISFTLEKESSQFRLIIDAAGDVELERKDVGGDGIRIVIQDSADLSHAEDWIADDEEPDYVDHSDYGSFAGV